MGFQISSGLYRSVTNKCLRLPGSLASVEIIIKKAVLLQEDKPK